jgi:hypothetical protein
VRQHTTWASCRSRPGSGSFGSHAAAARAGCGRGRLARARRVPGGAQRHPRVRPVAHDGRAVAARRAPRGAPPWGAPPGPGPRLRPARPGAPTECAARARTTPRPRRDSGWSERTEHQGRCWLPPTVSNDLVPLPSRIRARPSPPPARWRSSNSSACWPPGSGTGPQPRSGGRPIHPGQTPGASSATSAASSSANSPILSSGSTASLCARMPCFSAFCADRALPSSVFGPRDFAPFLRLASARASLTGTAARCDCPPGCGVAASVGE